ncbi:uncharacterized protein LOC135843845 isoform X2 [Planococcus citri]|uniref:uncharacterized protein LOC135843845 isoform X2 n=1 Tax=Planococcus citri TaxID=170843 RepID=UPI0031F8989C
MSKFYLVVGSLSLLFHRVMFVNSSSNETNLILNATNTNLKSEFINDFKTVLNNLTKAELLHAKLDPRFDEFTSRMASLLLHWIRLVRIKKYSIGTNETMKASTNIINELKNDIKNEFKKLDTITKRIMLNLIANLSAKLRAWRAKKRVAKLRKLRKRFKPIECQGWNNIFVDRALDFGDKTILVIENERMKERKKKKGKNHAITDILAPRMTTTKGVNELQADLLDGFRNHVPYAHSKRFLNDPGIFDSLFRELNSSINDGLRCDRELLYTFLHAESVNEVRRMLQQYSYFCLDYENNRTKISREHGIRETRQQIYKLMVQNEFFSKLFSQVRRNFLQSRAKLVSKFHV